MNSNKPPSLLYPPPEIHLIGLGGTGSWVAPVLVRLVDEDCGYQIHLWDGDTLEEKNLDRQMFPPECVGLNKAEAMAGILDYSPGFLVHREYFHSGSEGVGERSLLLCCADNHSARLAVLVVADLTGSTAIIAGNEYTDADAYLYEPVSMRGGPNDPRVFAPEILTEEEGDPRRPEGCIAGQAASPQLVIANMASAVHMLRLLWWWFAETKGLPLETKPYWPVLHRNSASRSSTVLLGDRLAPDRLAPDPVNPEAIAIQP